MAVLQMQKIHICALKSNRKQILEELQRKGIVQVDNNEEEDQVFRKMDTASMKSGYEKRAQNAEAALKALDTYAPEKTGLLASFEGKKEITTDQYYEQVKEQENIFRTVNRILALERHIGEDRAAQIKAEAALESLTPWMALDVPMNYKGSRKAEALIGTLPGAWTQETILAAVAKEEPTLDAWTLEVLGADRDQTCIFAMCVREEAEKLENALRVNGFARAAIQNSQTPDEYAKELEKSRDEYALAEKGAIDKLKAMGSEREKIRFVADYYTLRAEKYGILGGLLQSSHVFFLNGYIPSRNAEALKSKLEGKYNCQVELEAIPEGEEAPVILQNNSFANPTEGVVESFGLPHKGEIDPTSIMAVFYYFLFGLMLSDAGYGIILTVACFVLVKKYPNMGKGMKQMMRLMFFCGISTTVWGILFGGYFGDVIPIVAENFFHTTVTVPAVWFAPLDDPMKLLIYSFLFGVIHLFTGLALKGYMLIRDKKYMDCLCSVGFWYALLIGLIMMLLPSDIFASMAGASIVFPGWLNTVAKALAIIGALGIVLMTARDNKNIGLRIALGAYELYGATSWLSDVLSYSRLLALGLATGVIASVINTMAAMVGDGIVGAILFTVIFLVGHTLNLAINVLGAYVHTNRLQFVEFFGKFYEGGGRAFTPFCAAQTKYIQFKEEN